MHEVSQDRLAMDPLDEVDELTPHGDIGVAEGVCRDSNCRNCIHDDSEGDFPEWPSGVTDIGPQIEPGRE